MKCVFIELHTINFISHLYMYEVFVYIKLKNLYNLQLKQVMGVLLVILSSVDNGSETPDEHKTQRHFNRAMAMRSIRGVTLPAARGKKKGGS